MSVYNPEAARRYYQKNKERLIAYRVKWNREHPQKSQLWRKAHPESNRSAVKRIRLRNHTYIQSAKNRPCIDCCVQYNPWVMQFDHRDPKLKSFDIGKMEGFSLRRIQLEIDKCDIVCANCHAERTWKQRQ